MRGEFLVAGMLFTGTVNTILNKLQDMQCVAHCHDPQLRRNFEQPVWQTLIMFVGEALCLAAYFLVSSHAKEQNYAPLSAIAEETQEDIDDDATAIATTTERVKLSGHLNLLLWIPTLCDMLATTLMNVGLIFVSASVYQMLRGSVVLFTALLSTVFLGRRHPLYRWFGLVMVFAGVAIVGVSSVSSKGFEHAASLIFAKDFNDKNVIGIGMVILAQVFTACQFVIEEKVLNRFDVDPLKAVGLEGIFGLLSVATLLPFAYYGYGIDEGRGGYFDLPVGFHQLTQNALIFWPALGIIVSIAMFNWFGLSVTRSVSATSRSTIDTCRTLLIWIVSLMLGWEMFSWLEVLGFCVLIYGYSQCFIIDC